MSDILTTFPTEAIPGRWRWHLNGRVDTVRCGTFAAVVKGDAVIGVVFVGEGAPRSVTDGTAFDPDSDHFERIDVPAEVPKVAPVEAAERVVGMKWRHADRRWDWIGEEGAELAIVWHGPPGDWDIYPFAGSASPVASGDGADHSAASLALLRAIDAGRVTLPNGAPGMGALSAAERAALGVG